MGPTRGVAVLLGLLAIGPASSHPITVGPMAVQTAREENLTAEQVMERLRQFHGHLGPYAVLGYRLGDYAVQALGVNRWFGLSIDASGPTKAPMGCFFDGMQLSSGCTFGKGNLRVTGAAPGAGGVLYHLEFTGSNGARLIVDVKPSVTKLFASWLQAGDPEETTFKRTMETPAAELWTEQRVPRPAPFADMQIISDPMAIRATGEPTSGLMRVVAFGKQFTAMHLLIPPGAISPPHQGSVAYESPTVITRGKLDILVPDADGKVQRTTLEAGTLFTWPANAGSPCGYANPYNEPCEYYTIYTPAFPGVTTPEQGTAWLEAGCPDAGPPVQEPGR